MEDHLSDRHSQSVKALGTNLGDKYNLTPPHNTSRRGNLAVTAILLKKGADASLMDKFVRTTFIVAWLYGYNHTMRIIIAAGYERPPSTILDDHQSPVWLIVRQGLTELVV